MNPVVEPIRRPAGVATLYASGGASAELITTFTFPHARPKAVRAANSERVRRILNVVVAGGGLVLCLTTFRWTTKRDG